MKFLSKVLAVLKRAFFVLIEPLKLTVNRGFSEKTIKMFNLHKVLIYIISLIITAVIVAICYNT